MRWIVLFVKPANLHLKDRDLPKEPRVLLSRACCIFTHEFFIVWVWNWNYDLLHADCFSVWSSDCRHCGVPDPHLLDPGRDPFSAVEQADIHLHQRSFYKHLQRSPYQPTYASDAFILHLSYRIFPKDSSHPALSQFSFCFGLHFAPLFEKEGFLLSLRDLCYFFITNSESLEAYLLAHF